MQPSNIATQHYADDIIAESCKDADLYDKEMLNDVFIERADASVPDSLRAYWGQNSLADLTDIACQAESMQSIRKDPTSTPYSNRDNGNSGKSFNRKLWKSRNSANNVNKHNLAFSALRTSI